MRLRRLSIPAALLWFAFTLSPQHLVLARLLGGAAALAIRRQPVEKLLFNCAQWWLDTLPKANP